MRYVLAGCVLAVAVASCGGRSAQSAAQDNLGGSGGQVHDAGGTLASPDYVPNVAAPFNSDHFAGGSFEESPGFGWDLCYTRTPGKVEQTEAAAGHGSHFIEISAAPCVSPCDSSATSDAQLYLWLTEGTRAPASSGLYVELANLGSDPAMGSFELYAADRYCESQVPLLSVPLEVLAPSAAWTTRCFEVGLTDEDRLGIAVRGDAFHVGLDAIRFGPPCD